MRARSGYLFCVIAISASCGEKITVPPSIVVPTPVVSTNVLSVTVIPGAVTLQVGERVTMAGSVIAEAGVTDRSVTWTSSNTGVAAVDANGIVTAVAPGTTTIVARSRANPAVSGAASVTVVAPTQATSSSVYNVTLTVALDPSRHEQATNYTSVRSITCTTNGSTLTITGAAPWVTVSGTLNANGTFTASGQGTVAGRSNVTVTVTGTATGNSISGNVVIGPGLPDNNETLSFTGTRQ